MTEQDKNWLIVAYLGFPWNEAAKLETDDREYLVKKAERMKEWTIENKPPDQQMPPLMEI
jgi:hypothetical protein